MKTRISPTAIAVTAACVLFQAVSALALPADVLFHEDFENPDVAEYSQGITPEIWVRASVGFGSGDHGMTDKSDGDFSAPAGNEQAYAFRYKNSGITTKEFALGPPLAFGGGYEVSFDVVMDNSTSGRAYNVGLIAFGAGAIRNDCRSIPTGSTQLATATGNAPADGSIATVTFTFIPNATTHAAEFGKDPGIRVKGSGASAIIDNIRFRAIPGTGTGLNLVTTSPVDNSSNNLAYLPAKAIFNKNIAAGSGNITLRDLTDNIDTVIPVGDPRISISGTCLNVVAGAPYTWDKDYAIRIDPGAVVEASPGANSFAGIADDTTWNFSTAGGDPLYYSISRLKDHITGTITLTAEEIDTIKRNLDTVVGRFAETSASITALLDLIHTYDTGTITGRKGPLWVSQSLPRRDAVTNDLHWTMFNVMQNVMDRIYTAPVLAAHEDLLDGFKFGSHTNFPGPCPPPADPAASHTVTIQGSFEDTFGRHTQQWTLPARKPTGTYLAPGTIATVTVPPEIVNLGYQVRVGAHSWNLAHRPHVRRLDRATRVYPIDAPTIKVASPYGGGIYIEVPFRADAGLIDVTVTGAVRSPYFSAKSFHQTTPAEWLVERAHVAPWADFQSDKFMTQVPTKWIYAHPDPAKMLADWDKAMDAINDLMGFPHLRGKETMYLQVDLIMRASVYAPGYPAVNVTDNPNNDRGGYHTNYLVRGPGVSSSAANWEFHEQGHAYFFPKFGGERESNVNLLHVPVLQEKFGYDLDTAFRGSLGSSRTYITLDTTAMAWMCVFNFAPRRLPMASAEKSYQFKGHAKFVDIARLYGWDGLGTFWRSFMEDDANGVSYSTSTDAKLLRLCKSVGKDIRPLFHFWGIHPDNPSSLAASIAAEGLQPAPEIYHRLVHYKSIVPANNAEFRTFAQSWRGRVPSINGYWEEREHARQWDTTPLYPAGDQQRSEETNPGEIYNEYSAADIRNRIDEIIDLYFPSEITPNPMTFATAPAAIDATTIGMVATNATAATGPIEYYFAETSGNPGGDDSGWQTSPSYQDGGLTPGLTYSYTVTARDGLGNLTAPSAVASAMAETDVTPPAPDPLTFASPPTALGSDAITMTATAATDINGVEYQFVCIAGGGNDSGWQDSPTYVDNGLEPGTSYTYRVRARDKSPAQNATDWSAEASATTEVPDITPPSVVSFDPPNGATAVRIGSPLEIIFDEEIVTATGFITLKNLSDDTETAINITDGSQVSVEGTALIITPTGNLASIATYAVRIGSTAIEDLAGNTFAGIADDTTWSFTTASSTPGVYLWTGAANASWTNPANWDANGVPVDYEPDRSGLSFENSNPDRIVINATNFSPTTNVPQLNPGHGPEGTPLHSAVTPTVDVLNGHVAFSLDSVRPGSGHTELDDHTFTTIGDGDASNGLASLTYTNPGQFRRGGNFTMSVTVNSDGSFIFGSGSTLARTGALQVTLAGGSAIFNGTVQPQHGNSNPGDGTGNNWFDFTAVGASFTAAFGSIFADLNWVNYYIDDGDPETGDFFRTTTNLDLEATDNGDGTFTVSVADDGPVGPNAYDAWAAQIPDVNLRGRDDDADGDGFTNLQEFLFGTSPTEPTGSLTTIETSGSDLIIRWKQRTEGATYTLQQSATLANDWVPSSIVPVNDGSAINGYQPRMATVPTGSGKLFLRVQAVED